MALVPGQLIWDFWWTNWPSDRYFSKYNSSFLSVTINKRSTLIRLSVTSVTLVIHSVVKQNTYSLLYITAKSLFPNLPVILGIDSVFRYEASPESKDTKVLNMYNIFNLQKPHCQSIACT